MTSTSSKDIPYPLQRNALGSTRLNLNHLWMKSLTGSLLHPDIPTDQKGIRVLDLGPGTGIWASEVADLIPNASIDAVDISAEQFPPEGFRAANVNFWTHDAFKPFPDQYLGQYDIVNLRFWLCIINDDVADGFIGNVLTLLRPGGYIQWFEPLPDTAHVRVRNGDVPTPACDKLVQSWKKPSPHSSYRWVHGLPQLLEDRKLDVVIEEKFENPDRYLPLENQSYLLGLAEYEAVKPELKEFLEAVAKENAGGAFVTIAWRCVIVRSSSSRNS